MNRLLISSSLFALLLVLAGCGKSGPEERDGAGDSAESDSEVAVEAPAPLQPPRTSFVYNFDGDAPGKIAAKFHEALTGGGSKARWVVETDQSAPSQSNVLAQLSADQTSYRFPLAIADEGSFKDFEMSVKFKPLLGRVDQAAGLVWRLRDANNYYVARANALEGNVVAYKVEKGKRTDLDLKGEGRTYGKKAPIPAGQWSELKVIATGNLFQTHLNGVMLFEVEDSTFTEAGKVGLWTRADSVSYFDDLRIVAK